MAMLGCGGFGLIPQRTPTQTPEPSVTLTPILFPTETATFTPTLIPTETLTPSPSPIATQTFTPSATATPEFIFQGPGEVIVPILLYHHISISPSGSLYYVSPEEFDRQMYLLYAWGYRTISIQQMVDGIRHGSNLPGRPIILTFDDGSESVYTEAMPIMQKYGFTGTAFVVYNYIGAGLYLDADQIRALHDSGWEIGSHSLSHVNLRQRPGKQEDEIYRSKIRLERWLGFPIPVFAYPFGANDASSLKLVRESGYIAAVGLGEGVRQSARNIYYLYRRDITSAHDLTTFAGFLPWQEDVNNLPAVTIVP
ncbi:MAG TPA: polysaccharide deacetylase family protein [Anaerolineales bacterium]|nr:polysaccharide deacetylase family protein [Anaerolineales bacterium]